MLVEIDAQRCTGCGVCVRVCPQKVLDLRDGKAVVKHPERCIGCFGCEDECPVGAARVVRAPRGMETPEVSAPRGSACDVAVIGAGPSGLAAALTCARAGLDVMVFERLPRRGIGHHPDGGLLVAPPGMEPRVGDGGISFPGLDISLRMDALRRCAEVGLVGPDGMRSGSRVPEEAPAWVVDKDALLRALAEEAQAAGARLFYGSRVRDLVRRGEAVGGVVLEGGERIRSRVTVCAEGVGEGMSIKAGFPVRRGPGAWHAHLVCAVFDNREGAAGALYYINGQLDRFGGQQAFAAVGVGERVQVMLIFLSRTRFYPAGEPMSSYIERFLREDKRLGNLLPGAVVDRPVETITGCRSIIRDSWVGDMSGDGVVIIGDTWVHSGELGNVPSMANGVHAGRVIIEAARHNDFSRQRLAGVNTFISKNLLGALQANRNAKLLPGLVSEEDMRVIFAFLEKLDYPLLFFGSDAQRRRMFLRFLLRNLHRFILHPRLGRLALGG